MIELDISRRAQEHLSALTERGYDVMVPDDYAQIPSLVLQTGRPRQNPMHAISRNDFTKEDAFWLFLTHNGRVVGGTAACRYDLRQDSFEDFLRRTSAQQYGRSEPIQSIAKPIREHVEGQLIYLGELQLHPDFRGNIVILTAFFRMLKALSALKWEFDYMYAFIPQEHRRLISIYGFNWWVEHAIRWRGTPPPGRKNDHIFCAISRLDFEHHWSITR